MQIRALLLDDLFSTPTRCVSELDTERFFFFGRRPKPKKKPKVSEGHDILVPPSHIVLLSRGFKYRPSPRRPIKAVVQRSYLKPV